MTWNRLITAVLLPALLLCSGCASLLPSTKDVTRTPWNSYEDVRTAYGKVEPNTTTVKQLRTLGFNIYSSPNVKILNYVDIAVATQSIKFEDLSGGLAKCLKAGNNCRGYEFEPKVRYDKRYGNFWLDFFNFRRKTRGTGWQFKADFFVIDDIVVEKIWSGTPFIHIENDQKNPLGPLQEGVGIFFRLVP